ncbi:MAG: ATP-binding protein [Leptolyngbya sp. SIOISBB]|nr:ATP-binding protein [Leptolyngbya sp. SIOISBB]
MEKPVSEHQLTAAAQSQSLYLIQSLVVLEQVLIQRLKQSFATFNQPIAAEETLKFPVCDRDDPYSCFVRDRALSPSSQLLLLLALVPWIQPDFFDQLIQNALPEAGDYPQLGGIRGRQHRGFLPTGDTALFLLAGEDLTARLHWQAQLWGEHPLVKEGILSLEAAPDGEPPMSGRLVIDTEYAERFLTGKVRPPRMSFQFPAHRLATAMAWDDLVLPTSTLNQVKELEHWLHHESILMEQWGMGKKLRPGCRALFYGPPGTGKTLTATLLGQATQREVYKIDLSMVVSKYIGETEKNLAALFDKAEHKGWILFFDEADSLFGKRTQVRDSHDRYANQEVSFLLQRVETFDGLVILASNLSNNVDEAFARRFEQIIHFPMPRQGDRRLIWQKGLPEKGTLEPGLDLNQLAARYELSGGMIMNVIRFVCLQAIARYETVLRQVDFHEGIRREYAKENRLE